MKNENYTSKVRFNNIVNTILVPAKSEYNEIKAKLDDLKIKAPFDGYTGIKNFSVGSFIMPGDVIAELHDINTLKIQAFIPEIFSNRLEIG